MSLEMQTPKLLWLKTHMKSTWARAAHFLDLPDFLTCKASGHFSRYIIYVNLFIIVCGVVRYMKVLSVNRLCAKL